MGPTDPFKTQPPEPGKEPIPDFHPDCRAGDMVGDYRLVRRLGAGGFGTVFLAERVRPFAKEVALKVISADRSSDPVALARFEMERRLLAQLEHPNVAALLDGGNSVSGQMFLVMDFVRGTPITQYCDENKVRIRARLGLFLQLLDAIQYAHARNVIHRDLSPRNVLVEADEHGAPRVKVIDFGLAKSVGPALDAGRNVTGEAYLPGTPGYASPEQFEPGAPLVDTRSDIYSLGAILYELLAGAPPFDPDFLRAQGWDAIRRVMRERTPRTPSDLLSTIATTDTATAERIATARQERLGRLAGTLRQELQYIPLQALRPDQNDRYQTVREMAGDVRAYLSDEPVRAAPPSWRYRARKALSRHRRAVAVSSLLLAALVATTVTVSVSLADRNRALVRAERREQELLQAVDFMARRVGDLGSSDRAGTRMAEEVLRQADALLAEDGLPAPDRSRKLEELTALLRRLNHAEIARLTVDELLLTPAADRARADHSESHGLRGALLVSLGHAHHALQVAAADADGDARARALIEEAQDAFLREHGTDDPRVRWTETWLARLDPDAGRGLRSAERMVADRTASLGPDSPETLEAMRVLRDRLQAEPGGLQRAIGLARALAERSTTEGSVPELEDRIQLGALLIEERREEAIETLEQCVDRLSRPGAPAHLAVLASELLGGVLSSDPSPERRQRGRRLLEDAMRTSELLWGERHPSAFLARSNFAAAIARDHSDDAAAVEAALAAIDRSGRLAESMPITPVEAGTDLNTKAVLLRQRGSAGPAEVLELQRRSLRVCMERMGMSDDVLELHTAIADSARRAGALDESLQFLERARAERERRGERASTRQMLSLSFERAMTLECAGRRGEAIEALAAAQAAAQADPERPLDSESRWLVSSALLGLLERDGAEPSRVAAQRTEVSLLRAATKASGRHGLRDWSSFLGCPANAR